MRIKSDFFFLFLLHYFSIILYPRNIVFLNSNPDLHTFWCKLSKLQDLLLERTRKKNMWLWCAGSSSKCMRKAASTWPRWWWSSNSAKDLFDSSAFPWKPLNKWSPDSKNKHRVFTLKNMLVLPMSFETSCVFCSRKKELESPDVHCNGTHL